MAASDQYPHSPIWRSQGATGLNVGSGGTLSLDGGAADFSSGRVTFPGSLARGYIPLSLMTAVAKATATASGLVPLTTGTQPQRHSRDVTGGPTRVRWTSAAGATNQLFFEPIRKPADMSTAGGLSLHLIAEGASGNTATNEFVVQFFAGAATTSGGFTTVAFTSAIVESTVVISSAQVPTSGVFQVALVPATHASGSVDLYGAGLSYTKRTS